MAAESPAKRARTEDPGTSYYKVVDGKKYDKKLLEEAEAFARDGQISYPEAKKLVESAKDGQGITDIEVATLKYAMETWRCSPKAKNFLEVILKDPSDSYYKHIDGKTYDRELLDAAEVFAADGQISHAEVKRLIELAKDGKRVSKTEADTLKYALGKFKFTTKAKDEMEAFLGNGLVPSDTGLNKKGSYYVQIDGVQYDQELLKKAKAFVGDGQISYEEAQALFAAAKDGPGITECEKRTLAHTLKTMTYTDRAKQWMSAALADLGMGADSCCVQIDEVQCDKSLLEVAQAFVEDGQISYAEAQALFKAAKDGPDVTECEKRTLEHTLKTMKYTDKAKQWMSAAVADL